MGSARATRIAALFGVSDKPPAPRKGVDIDPTHLGAVTLLTGPSGSGKSTALRSLERRARRHRVTVVRAPSTTELASEPRPVIDLMPNTNIDPVIGIDIASTNALAAAGLADARLMISPASALSEGERARVALAIAVTQAEAATAEPGARAVIVADEFGSTLDRETAHAVAINIARWIERLNEHTADRVRLVAATAHEDMATFLPANLHIALSLGGPVRFNDSPRVKPMRFDIDLADTDDYHALAHFHYRSGRPASITRVLRATRRETGERAAVLVVSMPTRLGAVRERAWPGRYVNKSGHPRLDRLNAELRRVSRVIVDPRYRGLGLARRLVRAYLDDPLTPATEAIAAMGAVSPFFERATMTPYRLGLTPHDQRLADALHHARVPPWRLLSAPPSSAFIENELARWWRARRRPPAPTSLIARDAAQRLTAPPIAYAHSQPNTETNRCAKTSHRRPRPTGPPTNRPRSPSFSPPPSATRSSTASAACAVAAPTRCSSPSDSTPTQAHHPPPAGDRGVPRRMETPTRELDVGIGPRPRTPAELHAWLAKHLELVVPTSPLIDGHSAPFDYLCHAYFDGAPPTEAALPQLRAGSPDCVVWANRGGGKTFLAAVATLLDLVFKPTIEVRVLAGSLDQAKRMYAHLRALFEQPPFDELIEGRVTEKRLALTNGSNVELLAQSQRSVRGTRVQKLRCDEVELFDPEVWEAAQLVTRSKQCGEVWVPGAIECLSTMHVPHGLMWRLVRAADTKLGADRALFRWGVVDVLDACGDEHDCATCTLAPECRGKAKARDAAGEPAGHISVTDAVTLKSRVSEATWVSEMLSKRPSRRDAVLPEFDPAVHVRPAGPPSPDAITIAGMDFGIRAPTVILWARLEPTGVLHVIAERSVSNAVMRTHVDALVRRRPERSIASGVDACAWVGVDPAGNQRNDQTGESNVRVMRLAGLMVRDRRLPIIQGLEMIRARLRPAAGATTLHIDPACTTLIESIERYRYPMDRPESNEPIKDGADHAVDALRYLVQNLDAPYQTRAGRY